MAIIHEPGPSGPGGRSTRALSAARHLTVSGKSVLDLGCKEGYNSLDFCDLGATKVLGVEAREFSLEKTEFLDSNTRLCEPVLEVLKLLDRSRIDMAYAPKRVTGSFRAPVSLPGAAALHSYHSTACLRQGSPHNQNQLLNNQKNVK